MSLLDIKGLESGYGNLKILKGMDLCASREEITLIIGPNGAGKSTVLKSVFNLCDIHRGRVLFDGKNITDSPTHDRIRMGVSLVPQGRQVFRGLSVRENLRIGAYLTSDEDAICARIDEVLCDFPALRRKLGDDASSLSGGEQQMLSIARALMQDPKLLLMDEPSLGLSPILMKDLWRKIIDIRDSGTAVLMVEQNAKSACGIADSIYVLEEGRIALKGGKAILKDPRIKHIYLGGHGHR